ncbi:MAG: electron transfer flavoprotein subunit beta/FixA family protein [Myxococcota bacterium]
MKILVCLKQVPHRDARLEPRADGSWIQDDNIKFEINDYDSYAIEAGLRLKDAGEAEVAVVTIGPDRTTQALRTALGMGADRAIQVRDPALDASDALGIAKALAAVARSEKPDLVLMGLMADDDNLALVGPMLAELAGVPYATGVVSLEQRNGGFVVERELEGGALEVRQLPMPCLLTVQTGINEVRYASLKGIMQAKRKPLDVLATADLGLGADDVAPRVKLEKLYSPPRGEGAEIIEGSPDEVAAKLVTRIKELGLL